jgi:integrase
MVDKKFKFSKATINALPLPESGKRDTYLDTKESGLQLRVTSTGAKTFSLLKRIKAGKVERVTLGSFPDMTVDQARDKALKLKSDMSQGINPNDDPRALKQEITLQEVFDEFIKNRRNKNGAFLSEKTKRTYQYDFDAYLGNLAERKLSKIKDTDFSALHDKIGREHPTQANRVIAMASSIFGHATERKLFKGTNPAAGIKKFPEVSRDRFLQTDELPAFFQSLSEELNETVRDYFLVSLLTGARRSNVQAMRWNEINLDRQEWKLSTTKNGTPQTVTLSNEVVEILRSRYSALDEWVFPSHGTTGHIIEPKRAWKRILDRAGLSDLRIHDLRRTLGSWQAKTGASLVIIGKSLNHKSHQTTAIYARLDQDPVRESIDRATAAMLGAAGLKPAADVIE